MSDEQMVTIESVDAETGEVTVTEVPLSEYAAGINPQAAALDPTAAERDERLTLIQQRAAEDPAYAALAREMGVV